MPTSEALDVSARLAAPAPGASAVCEGNDPTETDEQAGDATGLRQVEGEAQVADVRADDVGLDQREIRRSVPEQRQDRWIREIDAEVGEQEAVPTIPVHLRSLAPARVGHETFRDEDALQVDLDRSAAVEEVTPPRAPRG